MVYTVYPMGKPILLGSLLPAIFAACTAAKVDDHATAAAGSSGTAPRSKGGSSGSSTGGVSADSGMPSGGIGGSGAGSTTPPGNGSTDADAEPDGHACSPSVCSDHGVCTSTARGTSCACDEGFDPPDCSARNADYGRRVKVLENLADPDVIALSDDRYVLSGTGSGIDFEFLESRDLFVWKRVASYNPSVADPSYDYCFCWAPDIASVDGKLYLYFSAHRGPNGSTTCPPPNGFDVTTYRAAAPDGTLDFGVPEPLFQGQSGAQSRPQAGCPAAGCGQAIRIDPAVYAGRLYYVFFDRGNNIASVSMNDPSDYRLHAGPAGFSLLAYEEDINEAP